MVRISTLDIGLPYVFLNQLELSIKQELFSFRKLIFGKITHLSWIVAWRTIRIHADNFVTNEMNIFFFIVQAFD